MNSQIKRPIKKPILIPYSASEELAHSIIHGLGVILGLVGLTVLLVLSHLYGTNTHTISYLIYGSSLILLYTASTLYHSIPNKRAKHYLKICDHAAIYLLIAGTYTPFLLLNLEGNWRLSLMSIIWGAAFIGVIFKFFFTGKFRTISTLIYLGMGWVIVVAAKPLSQAVSNECIYWLVAGGLTYTIGTIFYSLKQIRFHHAVWHLFVLSASIFHFIAVLYASNLF